MTPRETESRQKVKTVRLDRKTIIRTWLRGDGTGVPHFVQLRVVMKTSRGSARGLEEVGDFAVDRRRERASTGVDGGFTR